MYGQDLFSSLRHMQETERLTKERFRKDCKSNQCNRSSKRQTSQAELKKKHYGLNRERGGRDGKGRKLEEARSNIILTS